MFYTPTFPFNRRVLSQLIQHDYKEWNALGITREICDVYIKYVARLASELESQHAVQIDPLRKAVYRHGKVIELPVDETGLLESYFNRDNMRSKTDLKPQVKYAERRKPVLIYLMRYQENKQPMPLSSDYPKTYMYA